MGTIVAVVVLVVLLSSSRPLPAPIPAEQNAPPNAPPPRTPTTLDTVRVVDDPLARERMARADVEPFRVPDVVSTGPRHLEREPVVGDGSAPLSRPTSETDRLAYTDPLRTLSAPRTTVPLTTVPVGPRPSSLRIIPR